MKMISEYIATNNSQNTVITIWENMDGKFIPDSPELGMGHKYDDEKQAASDLAHRHGYWIVSST